MTENIGTLAELKVRADKLGLTYKAKILKADLIDLISEAEKTRDKVEFVPAIEPEVGFANEIAELEAHAAELTETMRDRDVTIAPVVAIDPGTTTGFANEIAELEARAAELIDVDTIHPVWVDSLTDLQRRLIDATQSRIDAARTEIDHALYYAKPEIMGLHFRGRAMGAKHHTLIRAAVLRDQIDISNPADVFMSRDDFRHTPNSERVQKYARQNVIALGADVEWRKRGLTTRPKLTHRQMRRVRKNANKHGEGFIYGNAFCWARANGHSLLARTPDGLGVFYRFVK